MMNISSGNKQLTCSAMCAAFMNGIQTFDTNGRGELLSLPIIKLNYDEIISDTKMHILKAIKDNGGAVESLEQLMQITGYGKPFLSYHISGCPNSLAKMGLLEVNKDKRGKSLLKLAITGEILLSSEVLTRNKLMV